MSHVSMSYHLVFSTYCRQLTIMCEHERELYAFIFEYSSSRGVKIRRIGGMPDHVHILADIPPIMSVSSFVQTLKAETSKFMRANPHFPQWNGWANGYGGFTVSSGDRQAVYDYIRNQFEHHRKRSFAEEYRQFLIDNGFTEVDSIIQGGRKIE